MKTNTLNEVDSNSMSNYSVLLKKMRLLKKLNRQQAALLFSFSVKNLERLENGRGRISVEKFREFQTNYGFSDNQVEDIKSGKIQCSEDANSIRRKKGEGERVDRRFCNRRISRECLVLKELRLMKRLNQYEASELCGFNNKKIGFIENGRITLTDKLINQIIFRYGFSHELFTQLLKLPALPHENRERCIELIKFLEPNKLSIILPMLQSMV